MGRQQDIRQAIREHWDSILGRTLRQAIVSAQASAAAQKVFASIWPKLTPGSLVKLDVGDPILLEAPSADTAELKRFLSIVLCEVIPEYLSADLQASQHARGADLKAIVDNELNYSPRWDRIRQDMDKLFAELGTDRLYKAHEVRPKVLELVREATFDELHMHVGSAAVPTEVVRHLKAYSLLASGGIQSITRTTRLERLTDHTTASLPYVLKYMRRDQHPRQLDLSASPSNSPSPIAKGLRELFSESAYVQTCVDAYLSNKGILGTYIDEQAPVKQHLEAAFRSLDSHVQMPGRMLYTPKGDALVIARREKTALIDGVVCIVALAALVESLLRQTLYARDGGDVTKLRPDQLVSRLAGAFPQSGATSTMLAYLFAEDCLSGRDSLAHGAFYANDEFRVRQTCISLLQGLDCLWNDLVRAGLATNLAQKGRWDAIWQFDDTEFRTQSGPKLNLADHFDAERMRSHYMSVLPVHVPDKSIMGIAGYLHWVTEQTAEHQGKANPAAAFAGTLACLTTLESLFRAALEAKNQPSITVTTHGVDIVKCELLILTDHDNQLMSTKHLQSVFGAQAKQADFQTSLGAVRDLRNHVMHGAWASVGVPMSKHVHLIAKLLVTLGLELGARQ